LRKKGKMAPGPAAGADSTNSHGNGVVTRLALASISASLSESATFPVDTLKTRLQLLRASSAPSSSSNLRLISSEILAQGGGFLGFYSGLSPAILRHLFYTPIRIVCYENLRGFAIGADADAHAHAHAQVSLLGKALAGGASGVFAQVKLTLDKQF
jgi:solute carrier family 25 (mitochondrial uncoupling protein), member 27